MTYCLNCNQPPPYSAPCRGAGPFDGGHKPVRTGDKAYRVQNRAGHKTTWPSPPSTHAMRQGWKVIEVITY